VTRETLEEMHWQVLPHPTYGPDVAPSDFHLVSLLRDALEGKGFKSWQN